MLPPNRPSNIATEDLPYVLAYINAANKGQSESFVGLEVVTSLILSVRDLSNSVSGLSARVKELEDGIQIL
jgi:hypothetical protein